MSKRIILFRHGKSNWGADYDGDHERPLADRGENDAANMGRLLASSGQEPDYIITSSAKRARSTIEIAMKEGGWKASVEISDDLYGAQNSAVLSIIRQLPDKFQSVMLVGHDPTWSELSGLLIGGGNVQLKTAAMACIDFECAKWREVDYGRGVLAWLIQPKLIRYEFRD